MRLIRTYENTLVDASPADTTPGNITSNRDSDGRQAGLISAFYGLDDALGAGAEGMPVIFSHEIDVTTMQAGDFKVTTASGEIGKILAVTLAPADDKGELRTVLFAGS
jgi:hypothetical protein